MQERVFRPVLNGITFWPNMFHGFWGTGSNIPVLSSAALNTPRKDEILNRRKADVMFKKKSPFSCELTPNIAISNKQKQNRNSETC